MTTREIKLLVVLLALSAFAGWFWWKGHHGATTHAETRQLRQEAKATAASIKISAATAARVDAEADITRTRTAAAQEAIHATVQANPDPAAGAADAVVLRIAEEAHDRAIRAACRVQRTSDCPAATDSSE